MENKPIAWVVFDSLGDEDDFFFEEPNDLPEGYTYAPLYTALPQREWQVLTDEEVNAMHYFMGEKWSTTQLVRHVESKLREKNT